MHFKALPFFFFLGGRSWRKEPFQSVGASAAEATKLQAFLLSLFPAAALASLSGFRLLGWLVALLGQNREFFFRDRFRFQDNLIWAILACALLISLSGVVLPWLASVECLFEVLWC